MRKGKKSITPLYAMSHDAIPHQATIVDVTERQITMMMMLHQIRFVTTINF